MIRLTFKTSSVTPEFFYVFNLILSFSTCSQSFKKICTWELLGANVLKKTINAYLHNHLYQAFTSSASLSLLQIKLEVKFLCQVGLIFCNPVFCSCVEISPSRNAPELPGKHATKFGAKLNNNKTPRKSFLSKSFFLRQANYL